MGAWWKIKKFMRRYGFGGVALVGIAFGLVGDAALAIEFKVARACFVVAAVWIVVEHGVNWVRIVARPWPASRIVEGVVRVGGVLAVLWALLWWVRAREDKALAVAGQPPAAQAVEAPASTVAASVEVVDGKLVILNRGEGSKADFYLAAEQIADSARNREPEPILVLHQSQVSLKFARRVTPAGTRLIGCFFVLSSDKQRRSTLRSIITFGDGETLTSTVNVETHNDWDDRCALTPSDGGTVGELSVGSSEYRAGTSDTSVKAAPTVSQVQNNAAGAVGVQIGRVDTVVVSAPPAPKPGWQVRHHPASPSYTSPGTTEILEVEPTGQRLLAWCAAVVADDEAKVAFWHVGPAQNLGPAMARNVFHRQMELKGQRLFFFGAEGQIGDGSSVYIDLKSPLKQLWVGTCNYDGKGQTGALDGIPLGN